MRVSPIELAEWPFDRATRTREPIARRHSGAWLLGYDRPAIACGRMRSPIVELEDRIGMALLLAAMGSGASPVLAGRYEILELRGRGARGVVCRVADRTLGREAALKIYPPMDDARLAAEVQREAQALARLEHANVVRVHDLGRGWLSDDRGSIDCVYLCMEYLRGRSMRAWCAEKRRSSAEVLRAIVQAGEGLAAAHAAGLVHRDFKPENVVIDSDGRVRVVDFGLAAGVWTESSSNRFAPGDPPWIGELADRLTQMGRAMGTLEYMAPEARRGEADARSDQFAFAVTTWECLSGMLPFDPYVGDWRARDEVEFRGSSSIPSSVRLVLERALAYDAARRFRDIPQLLRALRRAATAKQRAAIIVGSIGTLAVVGTGAYLLDLGRFIRVPEPASENANDGTRPHERAAAAAASCDALAGTWYVDNVILWARKDWKFYGEWMTYELKVEPGRDCALALAMDGVSESGSPFAEGRVRRGKARARAVQTGNGYAASATVPISEGGGRRVGDLRLELAFSGSEIRGDWQLANAAQEVLTLGIVAGGRVRADHPAAGLHEQPCASQCRVLCMTGRAAEGCIAARCDEGHEEPVRDCGPPPRNAPVPKIALANLDRGVVDMRLAVLLPEAETRGNCEAAARSLDGSWQIWRADRAQPIAVRLSASSCDLRGMSVADDATVEGVVSPEGAWIVVADDTYSLMGWGPAFGVSSGRIPVAAYRISTPTDRSR